MKFSELGLDQGVMDALEYMNYGECTPVQEKAIPPVLNGDDVIAVAQTGTGKTAAYLLPILSNLNRYHYPSDAINCVIMAPTRELAQQIDQQMQGFSYFVDASSVAVYGGGEGTDFAAQERGLRQGADVVIATPGRLLSHINLGYVDLSQVAFFVLDEADRMLDMGFYDDIMAIAKLLPDDCQKILYSATMPAKTQRLAENIMWNPVMVKIAISKPAEKIHQQCCICHEPQKTPMLIRFLKKFYGGREDGFVKDELLKNPEKRVVVFVSRKAGVRDVLLALRKKGFQVAAMHSDLEQKDREEVMNAFRAGRTNIIVATDIVSRGIDISGIALVINYDMPHDPEDYVHRIGRTARADNDGESLTLVNCNDRREMQKFAALERFIDKKMERIAVPEELGGCDITDVEAQPRRSRLPRQGAVSKMPINHRITMKTNAIIAHLTVIALIVVAALSAHQTQAAPARKQPLTIIQPDGSTLTIRLHGDEWCHWTTDLEGNLLVTDDKGFYHIANATEMAAWEVEKAGLLEKRARINAKRYERLKRSRRVQAADSIAADSTSNDSIAADSTVVYDPDSLVCDSILPSHFSFPSKGKIRGLVVLVEFQDVRFTIDDPLQEFTDMMNKDGYDRAAFQGSKYKHNGSAHDYFYENSMGLFDPQFDVYGPILLKDSVEYYGKNNDAKAWQMITEACAYLDDSLNIDFSIYDNDSNDVIDFVYAIYAGYGENATSNKSDIWPHAWDILTAGDKVYKFDDKMLNDYACSNELIGPYLDGVGTFCHEFTHVLGLPDLYATNNAAVCSPLEYDLLDYGCYNRNGYCPSGYSSYERYELGWLTPTVLSEQKTDTLMELSTSNQAFIVPVTEGLDDPRDGEYYLFENRQLTDWDAYIPGHGMMVWHIDYQEAKWWSNTPNNWINHQCIDLVEADGQKKQSGSYVQDDSTPFPGSAEITAFTDDTTPAFSGWTSTGKNDKTLTKRLGKPISSIQEIPYVDETGAELGPDLITFDFRTEPPAAIEAITLDPIETMPQTNKVYVDGRLMIRTENGTFDMMGRRK